MQEFGSNTECVWEVLSNELFLNSTRNLVFFLPFFVENCFFQMTLWQYLFVLYANVTAKLQIYWQYKYINLIWIIMIYIFYNLTLFRLVRRLLTKRLFLLCIEYTSNRGAGNHTRKFIETYTSNSATAQFVGETLKYWLILNYYFKFISDWNDLS